ncbi:MarR family winged helix-turn-helix transcriptional regulator [Cellulomonas dongxiuzhuiae]|uniref:MarR family transcriptional regulator n=1 Tax=Cellulomonas dongxiuzhuiae TaxID=2819979 RepID=A0ABX8GGE6_9CELL|nr:MarR family transcriptional regulator [Cellulomonas dongxiuzhuiae]MBO3093851.1 MarR family transcriptional regulator [Cellulomonas dongxiuzhuiae]QWC14945.1 MarR family transcriptional regulator [Cellulomonas dongxiuzhuiae]
MPPETRWLTPDELRAWLGLVTVAELLPAQLDSQLQQDAGLTHFEYQVLAMLSEASGRTLRMSDLARRTNATLPRLSHVVRRLEDRGLVERAPCTDDRRATNAHLTEDGWDLVVRTAPGHVETARALVVDALTPEQVHLLEELTRTMLQRLDPEGRLTPPLDEVGRA